MACSCGSKAKIRAAIEAKFSNPKPANIPSSMEDVIARIRKRRLDAIAKKEEKSGV